MKHAFLLHILIAFSIVFNHCKNQLPKSTNTLKADSVYTFARASPDGIGKFYKGREIAHIMGASGSDWLERSDREQEENTALAIQNMQIKDGDVVGDIGAGTGYLTFKIAPLVPSGKVYAVEVQQEMIDFINNKIALNDSKNVEVIRGTNTSPNLQVNSVDLAFMVDVYHELEYPHEMLQAIREFLKPDGKLLLIEYRGEDESVPIKPLHKTTISQLDIELNANGFTRDHTGEFLPIQHFLVYKKAK